MDKCEIVLTPDVFAPREGLISFTVPKSSTDFTDLNLKVFLFRNFFFYPERDGSFLAAFKIRGDQGGRNRYSKHRRSGAEKLLFV